MGRRQCPVCKSKQWHKEPASGLITCSEGHVLQNYRNETRETTEIGSHWVRKRQLNSGRTMKEDRNRADDQLYHGARARYHYFECLQLLLRKQVAVLIREWNLPREFEVICRDAWVLHLNLLRDPPPPEPYLFAQERGGTDEKGPEEREKTAGLEREAKLEEEGRAGVEHRDGDNPNSSGEEEASEEDTLLDELLREASESESSDDDESRVRGKIMERLPILKARNMYEKPVGNIAVLMFACWTMRLPVMYMDLIRLIEAYKLPYLEGVRMLPEEMRRHLARATVLILSPRFPPSVLSVHKMTSRLARLCWQKYGIQTPEVNGAPMLWRVVRALKGGPTLYWLAKTMGRVLSLPLTLHPVLSIEKGGGHKRDNVPAEMAFVCAVVVVLKLVYGLDGRARRGVVGGDPAFALPMEEDYLACLRESGGEVDDAGLFSATGHVNVLKMDESQLDKYLDFCQQALLPATSVDDDHAIAAHFPLPRGAQLDQHQPAVVNRHMRGTSSLQRGSFVEPAQSVRVYRALDLLGSLPPQYVTVLDVAARFIGVSAEDVARVVETLERRLIRVRCK